MTLKTNERNEQIENLQREISTDLYDEMLDIFEINVRDKRRENVENLYDKMTNFLNHLLRIKRMIFANVC